MNNQYYCFGHARSIVLLYHIDIDTLKIWQRITVEVRCGYLEGDNVLFDLILDFVVEVNTFLSVMSNSIGVI